jgi:hypothetical protein
MQKFVTKVSGLTAVFALAIAGAAFATTDTYDLSPAATGITDQITSVLTVVLPIAGGLIALMLGWRLLKRFVKA